MNKLVMTMSIAFLYFLAGISAAFTGSVYNGTYVDADTANTVGMIVNPPATTDLNLAKSAKLWYIRGFANAGTVYEADASAGAIDCPLMTTTLTGLTPYKPYEVFVVYWSPTANDWDVLAGFKPDALTEYNRTTGGVFTGGIDGNRNEYEARIGVGFADGNGRLPIYIDDTDDAERCFYDGLVYRPAFLPYQPQPADETLDVAFDATLSFQAIRDPNTNTGPDGRLVEHQIHLNTDPSQFSEPNAILPAGQPIAFNPSLQPNLTYYWRVDEKLNNGALITGAVWSFQTIKTVPDFNPPLGTQPINAWTFAGDDAVLTATAGTSGGLGGAMHYQWFRGLPGDETEDTPVADAEGHITGAQTSQLIVTVLIADEGDYYCRATNDVGAANSQAAKVIVKRAVAFWTLDEVDYRNGLYLDSTAEGHDADPNGVPTFVEGVNGHPNSAVMFGDNQAWANAGSWNPSAVSGQFTVALWARLANLTGAIQSMVSKRDSFANDGMMWSFRRNADGVLALNSTLGSANATLPFTFNQWQFMVVTYNGQTASHFVDGKLVASANVALSAGTDATIWLGDLDGSMAYQFNGAMDDIRIYNYALNAYEVAQMYVDVRTGEQICVEMPANDFNQDCRVDLSDFAEFVMHWLECGKAPLTSCD